MPKAAKSKHSNETNRKNKRKAANKAALQSSSMQTSTIRVKVNRVPDSNTRSRSTTQKKKRKSTQAPKRQKNNYVPKRRASKPKKRKNNKRILKVFAVLILIIFAAIFICTTPLFNVTEIDVIGNENVSSDEIKSLSQIKIGENMFKYMKPVITENIKGNAYVDDVNIKRILPNKIQITVEERQVKFMAKVISNYAYISNQGYILEVSDAAKEVPILEGLSTSEDEMTVGKRLNDDDLQKLSDALKIVSSFEENEISKYITSIDVSNSSEYTINLAEKGKTVHIGDSSNLSTKALYIKAILDDEEGIPGDIFVNGDINSGFKPFFREKV